MNTALDIAGSTVIGSILLLAIISLLFAVNDSNVEMSRIQVTQEKADVLADILSDDFNNAGIAVPDSVSAVITADSMSFGFIGDVDGNGIPDSVKFTVVESSDTTGSIVSTLTRRVNTGIVDDYVFTNISARFRFYNSTGNETSTPVDVYSVETTLQAVDNIEFKDNRALGFVQWRVLLRNIRR